MLTDGLGSVRQEMAGGDLQTTTTYEPYGNLLTQTGTSGTTYGFTGEQEDAATGLVYLRARYYNPSLHVFMNKDPWQGSMRYPATLHGFVYGFNNPARFVDPRGLDCFDTGNGLQCFIGGQTIGINTPIFTSNYVEPDWTGYWVILAFRAPTSYSVEDNFTLGCGSPGIHLGY